MQARRKEIKSGTLLLKENPFIYSLSSKFRTSRCDFCFNEGDLLKCSNCHYVYYCGKFCQKEGWPIHKLECKKLKNIAPRIVPDAARLLSRLVMKLQNGGDLIKSHYTDTKYRTFKDLMSHYSDLKEDRIRLEHFTSLCGVLIEYFGESLMPNSAELMGIYGRMCVNSFNICDQELRSLGSGIYLAATVIDHSCQPNAVAVFEGTTLYIRSLKTMPYLDWSHTFISYIDTLATAEARREELQSIYYFLCQCSRCLDIEESRIMNSAACTTRECEGLINIYVENETADTLCSKCGVCVFPNFIEEYNEISEFTQMHLQQMKHITYLDVCKVCLKRHKDVLHPLNILHVKTLDLAFDSSIDFAQWDEAIGFGMDLIPGYRKYLCSNHPLLGLLYLKLGKILVYKEKSLEALNYLQKAFSILKITHGEGSWLLKNELLPLLEQATIETSVIRH